MEIGVADMRIYLSGRKGCCRVENTHSFFVHDRAPSMDRNWRGSTPLSNRYRIAIVRGRPDPSKLPDARAFGHRACDSFFTRTLLVHVFIVRIFSDDNLNSAIYPNEC